MELTFPFKNMLINDFLRFVKAGFMIDFVKVQKGSDANVNSIFETYVNIYKSALPNFENELLQVINTTDQTTINAYFNSLYSETKYVKERMEKEFLLNLINDYNTGIETTFLAQVEKDSETFFSSEQRKMAHLELYEATDISVLTGFKPRQVIKTNYNFFCIEKYPELIDTYFTEAYHQFLTDLGNEFIDLAYTYGRRWSNKEIVSRHVAILPVLYVEGVQDIRYIEAAAKHLGKEKVLTQIDIRQRGGFTGLDKMWQIFKKDNWETVPQKKLLLYDCDTQKTDENLGYIYKRVISFQHGHPVKSGIENLFKPETIERTIQHKPALIDIILTNGTRRGQAYTTTEYKIHHQEKTNLCNWLCENGSKEDYSGFEQIFTLIEELLIN